MGVTKKGTHLLTRSADEVRKYRNYGRVIPIVMACVAILVILLYVIALMYQKYGSFTVSVNRYHELQYGLTLSETEDFLRPTAHLECAASKDITNIDGKTLDRLNLGAVDGISSGENYLCYTFYCKNVGHDAIDCEYGILISNMTLGAEKAARVRLMSSRNGQDAKTVDYAYPASAEDGVSVPEPGTTRFLSNSIVMEDVIAHFEPGEVCKFTVVIWFEGNDPECVDDILGGEFKIDMKFAVSGLAEIAE